MEVACVCVLLLAAAASVAAQSWATGKCPAHPAIKNFDINKFAGKWYEVERSFYLPGVITKCTEMIFHKNDNGLKVEIKTKDRLTRHEWRSTGTAMQGRNSTAVLKYVVKTRLPEMVANMMPGAGTYKILDTDYDSYAILWSCSDVTVWKFSFLSMHSDSIWVLGRKRELTVQSRARVYEKLDDLGIDANRLTLSKQKNCNRRRK